MLDFKFKAMHLNTWDGEKLANNELNECYKYINFTFKTMYI